MPVSTAALSKRRSGMGKFVLAAPTLLIACILGLADCAPQSRVTTAEAQVPPLPAGAARVWFLRAWDAPSGQGYVYAAAPTVFANGAPLGEIPIGSDFFRDFPPGTYSFTVQPYGLPTSQETTLHLTAGTQNYLHAQWL